MCIRDSINGKHVVGRVERKEEARKQYRAAVAAGHGAYLMDEEKSGEVFMVTVGNLPPGADCVIKLTYVTELSLVGGAIVFRLPASVAPAAREAAETTSTQKTTDSVVAGGGALPGGMSAQLRVRAACDVASIESTLPVRHKISGGRALVEYRSRSALPKDLEVRVALAEPNAPRLWLETDERSGATAAVLTLVPAAAVEDTAPTRGRAAGGAADRAGGGAAEARKT